jgi:hypothetical protein
MSPPMSRSAKISRIPAALTFALTLCLVCATSQDARGQSGGYTLTANLNPFFIHPQTGQDLTQGRPLQPITGLFRGADGWLYGLSAADSEYFGGELWAVLRVSPTTGNATVVVLFHVENSSAAFAITPGDDGRLYFPVREQAGPMYTAPGFREPESCDGGCVMVIDTLNHGLDVYYHFGFDEGEREGNYPDLIHGEDSEGALYVDTSSNNYCADESKTGDQGALVKIPKDADWGEAIVLEGYGCGEPPFDWSTVDWDEDWWQFSNGLYYAWQTLSGLRTLTQGSPGTPWASYEPIATIAASLGVPQWDVAEGSGYIYAITCCGGKLGGGVVLRVRVPSLASPDLIVPALSPPPTAASPGGRFDLTDIARNSGTEPAATSITRYFLSLTGEVDDVRLGNRYIPELPGGQESGGTTTVKIPDTAPLGSYVLVACADATLLVAEGDDGNNCRAATTPVLISRPDLVQAGLSNPPASGQPGGSFSTSDTVANLGGVISTTSTTRYFLSLDTTRNAGDILLSGTRSVLGVPPSGESVGTRSVTIPLSTTPGAYYLLACADDLLKVKELDEGNNCRASAGRIVLGRPDLATTHVGNPPAMTSPGRSFTIADTVTNQGQMTAVASVSRYYLSLDAVKDASDLLLSGTRSVPELAPGGTSSGTRSVTVPAVPSPGAYRIIACADDKRKVSESNELNNCAASAGVVHVVFPDLAQVSVSNPPPAAAVGGSFSLTDTVANSGPVATLATTTRYYLSLDATRSPSDVLLIGGRSVKSIGVGLSDTGSRVVTVPAVAAGTYFVIACADDTLREGESDESNNCVSAASTIVIG